MLVIIIIQHYRVARRPQTGSLKNNEAHDDDNNNNNNNPCPDSSTSTFQCHFPGTSTSILSLANKEASVFQSVFHATQFHRMPRVSFKEEVFCST